MSHILDLSVSWWLDSYPTFWTWILYRGKCIFPTAWGGQVRLSKIQVFFRITMQLRGDIWRIWILFSKIILPKAYKHHLMILARISYHWGFKNGEFLSLPLFLISWLSTEFFFKLPPFVLIFLPSFFIIMDSCIF